MLAYSSIAHVGYIMIGMLAMNHEGLGAMMYYIVVYGFMNLGAFAGAILFSNETGSDKIDDYAGLIRKRPLLCLGMAVCLFNLAGLPIPPAGFFAKIFVFWAGSSIQQPIAGIPLGAILIGVALATSVPAIYYYTQVVIKMIVDKPSAVVEALPKEKAYIDSPQEAPALALAMCLIVIVATGTTAVDPVMKFSKEAVRPLIAHPSTGPSPVSLLEEASPFKRSAELAGTTNLPH
jgi:NAD(P)H-quinone oxidoreductase subunit 2